MSGPERVAYNALRRSIGASGRRAGALSKASIGGMMGNEFSSVRAFFEVWIQPRKVAREAIDSGSMVAPWVLVPFYCFFSSLTPILYVTFLKWMSSDMALLTEVVAMTVFGIAGFWFFSLLVYLLARIMGGTGSIKDTAVAYAWAYAPCMPALALMKLGEIPKWLAVFGGETDPTAIARTGAIVSLLTILPSFIFFIWALVISCPLLAEAQKITLGKAVLVFLILLVLFVILMVALVILFVFVLHSR